MSLLEANYPERVKQVFVIKGEYHFIVRASTVLHCYLLITCGAVVFVYVSAPKVFPIAYNLMKPFLDEQTRQKVQVCGGVYKPSARAHVCARACVCARDLVVGVCRGNSFMKCYPCSLLA